MASLFTRLFTNKSDPKNKQKELDLNELLSQELSEIRDLYVLLNEEKDLISNQLYLYNSGKIKELRLRLKRLNQSIKSINFKDKIILPLVKVSIFLKKEEGNLKKAVLEELSRDKELVESVLKHEFKEIETIQKHLKDIEEILNKQEKRTRKAEKNDLKELHDLPNDPWEEEIKRLYELLGNLQEELKSLTKEIPELVNKIHGLLTYVRSNQNLYGYTKNQEEIMRSLFKMMIYGKDISELSSREIQLITYFAEKKEYEDKIAEYNSFGKANRVSELVLFDYSEYKKIKKYYQKEKFNLKKEHIEGYIPEIKNVNINSPHSLNPKSMRNYLFSSNRIPKFIPYSVEKFNLNIEIHKCDEIISLYELIKRGFSKFFKFQLWASQDRTYYLALSKKGESLFILNNINSNELLVHSESMVLFAGIPNNKVTTYLYHKENINYYRDMITDKADVAALGMSNYTNFIKGRIKDVFIFTKIQNFIFQNKYKLIEQVQQITEKGYAFNLVDKLDQINSISDSTILKDFFKKNPLYSYLICSSPAKIFTNSSYYLFFQDYFIEDWVKVYNKYRSMNVKIVSPYINNEQEAKMLNIFGISSVDKRLGSLKVNQFKINDHKNNSKSICFTSYPYGDLSYYLTKALLKNGIKEIFFSGTFGGLPIELFNDRTFRKGDLVAPDNLYVKVNKNNRVVNFRVNNSVMEDSIFQKDVNYSLGHNGNDPIEKLFYKMYLRGVFLTNHKDTDSVLLEFENTIDDWIKNKFDSVEVEIFEIAKAVAEKPKIKFGAVLNCSDVIMKEDISTFDSSLPMFKIKNRILDYFIENINLGYTEKMHKKVLSLVKEAHKSEKIYSEKYKSR